MAIVTYNDNGTIKVVKYGNYVVSTDADPVVPKTKQWEFVEGSIFLTGEESFTTSGYNSEYGFQGCAAPSILRTRLQSQHPAIEVPIGTRAAIQANDVGGNHCDSWAIFKVVEV